MTYELALKLKKAGFKQEGKSNSFLVEKDSDADSRDWVNGFLFQNKDKYVYNPLLTELIEACGDRFAGLLQNKTLDGYEYKAFENLWLIRINSSRNFGDFIKGIQAHGSTPEEAVANLWISLKQEKDSDDWNQHVTEMGELGVIVE